MSSLVPYVIEQTGHGERSYDIFSRLFNDRIIMLWARSMTSWPVVVVAQLLYLEGQDPEKDISVYINSPGGSVTAGMAIYDTMQYIAAMFPPFAWEWPPPWARFCFLRAKGKRFALPNSEIMIHQPQGGTQGQATDIKIQPGISGL